MCTGYPEIGWDVGEFTAKVGKGVGDPVELVSSTAWNGRRGDKKSHLSIRLDIVKKCQALCHVCIYCKWSVNIDNLIFQEPLHSCFFNRFDGCFISGNNKIQVQNVMCYCKKTN